MLCLLAFLCSMKALFVPQIPHPSIRIRYVQHRKTPREQEKTRGLPRSRRALAVESNLGKAIGALDFRFSPS
ncbi:hypothetical protein BC940DRAFT_172514 [Gongronella butleri]|nr:hypothetical protein BC940DRAFT_172514 [Gongronella butleri]